MYAVSIDETANRDIDEDWALALFKMLKFSFFLIVIEKKL